MTGSRLGLLIAAYIAGSVPTGYWLGVAWKGIDVRRQGSGNLGATNVLRVLGAGPALVTFTVDFLKGLIPVLIAKRLFPNDLLIQAGAGVAAVIGHALSIFVRFQGGKGMATSTGVFAALLPLPTLAAIAVFILATCATRFVSLGSLLGALTLAACSFIFSAPRPLAWTSVMMSSFVVWTHRTNIRRLARGTENRIEWRGKQT